MNDIVPEFTREQLVRDVEDKMAKINELQAQRTEAHESIRNIAVIAASGAEVKLERFIKFRDVIDYTTAMLKELYDWHRGARKDLWEFDLQALKAELLKAVQTANSARLEVLQYQTDKSNYLRDASRGGTTPEERAERTAAFDVLMVDARARARSAAAYRDKVRADLEAAQVTYNGIARRNEWPLEPEKAEPVQTFGLR